MSLRDAISTCSPPAHRTVPYGRRTVAALARRVLRVSASARRVAAAYAIQQYNTILYVPPSGGAKAFSDYGPRFLGGSPRVSA